jgi:phosphoribosyl 1,2-cyclic phosphodiesterase
MTVKFWGIRGTLPVPGKKTNRYGGNTNCVTLSIDKKEFFIFDAGTGIKELSNYLVKQDLFPFSARILISHPHYDHIHGIPFFAPLYMKGNKFDIYGTHHGDLGIKKLLDSQMDSIHFPVTMKEFAAKLTFHDIKEGSFKIDNIKIKTLMLNHPGGSLAYRVDFKGKSFCYVTDNELFLENSPRFKQEDVDNLINFIYKADVVVMDSTYFDEEYSKKIGWGHTSISRAVDVTDRAKVKLLCLYHHDPDQVDKDIDLKLKFARTLLQSRDSNTKCIAPHEGDQIEI